MCYGVRVNESDSQVSAMIRVNATRNIKSSRESPNPQKGTMIDTDGNERESNDRERGERNSRGGTRGSHLNALDRRPARASKPVEEVELRWGNRVTPQQCLV